MKEIFDNWCITQFEQNSNFFVIAADMGNFKCRQYERFIDVGNREDSVGSIVNGLLDNDATVVIYDCCSFVLRQLISSMIFYRTSQKGSLIIISYGSGFAYNLSGDGHYPFDDLILADLLNLQCYTPLNKRDFDSILQNTQLFKFIRIHSNPDTTERAYQIYDTYTVVTYGNLYHFLNDIIPNAMNLTVIGNQNSIQEDIRQFSSMAVFVEDQLPHFYRYKNRFGCDYGLNFTHSDRLEVVKRYFPVEKIINLLK